MVTLVAKGQSCLWGEKQHSRSQKVCKEQAQQLWVETLQFGCSLQISGQEKASSAKATGREMWARKSQPLQGGVKGKSSFMGSAEGTPRWCGLEEALTPAWDTPECHHLGAGDLFPAGSSLQPKGWSHSQLPGKGGVRDAPRPLPAHTEQDSEP